MNPQLRGHFLGEINFTFLREIRIYKGWRLGGEDTGKTTILC